MTHVDTYVAELDASAAVAALVERRRPHAGAHDVGNHEHDGARHARLGRQPHLAATQQTQQRQSYAIATSVVRSRNVSRTHALETSVVHLRNVSRTT